MRLLIDAHVLLWALSDVPRLPPRIADALRNGNHDCFVSAATVWELVIKSSLGKVSLPGEDFAAAIHAAGFAELPVRLHHGLGVRSLPRHHRDPFDRILIAQAFEEGLTIVTRDRAFAAYQVPVLWH